MGGGGGGGGSVSEVESRGVARVTVRLFNS